jgi:hypothetical protein
MNQPTRLPGAALAQELTNAGHADGAHTPFDLVLEAAQRGELDEAAYYRLLGRLWVLKRLMYYVYGGWAQGLNVNEYPPSVDYLLSKQIYDDSTHEMVLIDEILRRGLAPTQRAVFQHPNGRFVSASRIGHFVFTLRALANYAHNVRMAALNLGAKLVELAWLERFGARFPDPPLRALFGGLIAETASHVQMGRFVVERFVEKPVDQELCRRTAAIARRDYLAVLDEIGGLVLGVEAITPTAPIEIPRGLD